MYVIKYIYGLSLPNSKLLLWNNSLYYSNNNVLAQVALQSVVTSMQSIVDNLQNNSYTSSNKPYAVGYYQGNGASSRTISLGFTPIGVLVMWMGCAMTRYSLNDQIYGGLAITNHGVISEQNATGLSITTNGFLIYYNTGNHTLTNLSDASYHYIAFK